MTKKVFLILILSGLIIVFFGIYICSKKVSHFRTLEEKEIVSISLGYDEKELYFISDSEEVYIFRDKKLLEIDELKGVNKIITTFYETVALKDGKIYSVDESTYDLTLISVDGECIDICSGEAFYSVLMKNGEAWISWDINDYDTRYTGNELKKISIPNKNIIQIAASTGHRAYSETSNIEQATDNMRKWLSLIMLDENGYIWVYGEKNNALYSLPKTSENIKKVSDVKNVKQIAAGLDVTYIDDEGNNYVRCINGEGMLGNSLTKEEKLFGSRKVLLKGECTNIAMNSEKAAVLTDKGLYIYYKTLTSKGAWKNEYRPREYNNIDPNSDIFITDLGVMAISPKGDILWFRDGSLVYEYAEDNSEERKSYRIVPICNYF